MRLPRVNYNLYWLLHNPITHASTQANRRLISTSARFLKREYTDEPLKFTGSKAYTAYSAEAFVGPKKDVPSYQRHIVLISLAAFMSYFLLLREENDIDAWLFDNLYIYASPDQAVIELENRLKEEKLLGKDTTETEKKLNEVREKINEVARKQKELNDYNRKLAEMKRASKS